MHVPDHPHITAASFYHKCLGHLPFTIPVGALLHVPLLPPSPFLLLVSLMKPNETQFSHPNGQRLQFSKPNIFEVDLHDDSIRTRYPPSSSLSLVSSFFFCVLPACICTSVVRPVVYLRACRRVDFLRMTAPSLFRPVSFNLIAPRSTSSDR